MRLHPALTPVPPSFDPHKGKEGEAKDPHYRAAAPGYARSYKPGGQIDFDSCRCILQHGGAGEHSAEAKPNCSSINKLSLKIFLIIYKPAHAGAPHNLHLSSSKCLIPGISSAHRRTLYLPPLFLLSLPCLSSPPLPLASSTGRSLHKGRWRRTCSRGHRGWRRAPCRGPCGRCSTPPGRGEAPASTRQL